MIFIKDVLYIQENIFKKMLFGSYVPELVLLLESKEFCIYTKRLSMETKGFGTIEKISQIFSNNKTRYFVSN